MNRKIGVAPTLLPGAMPEPLAIAVTVFARMFSISDQHAYDLAKAGEIPTIKLGGKRVVPMAWVKRILAEAMPPATDAP